MVDGSKELLDITLQYLALFGVILRDLTGEISKSLHGFVCTFV